MRLRFAMVSALKWPGSDLQIWPISDVALEIETGAAEVPTIRGPQIGIERHANTMLSTRGPALT